MTDLPTSIVYCDFSDPWKPTHRHANGGLYRRIAEGIGEAGLIPMTVYDDAERKIWFRMTSIFHERFTPLEDEA